MSLSLYNFSAVVGAATLLYYGVKLLEFLQLHLRRSSLPRYLHSSKHADTDKGTQSPNSSSWALVTGSSDGIGLGLVRELARCGFNVVLHGRSPEKLSAAAQEIEKAFPRVRTRTLVLDACQLRSWSDFNATLNSVLSPLHLTVLVNNLGGRGSITKEWGPLAARSHEDLDIFLDLNTRFALHLTRAVLPLLKRSQPALIMNISSGAAIAPFPYAVTYSGAKAFINAWGRALRVELRSEADSTDIDVITYEIGKVITPGTWRTDDHLSFDTLSVEAAAKACLDKVGCGYYLIAPSVPHQLLTVIIRRMPEWVLEMIVRKMTKEEWERSDLAAEVEERAQAAKRK